MSEEVDLAVIQQTQETLGKYIKKPPLSEKLLKKPPFRFLHDVVKEVINVTGFMKDVFAEEELNIENVKDRDSKVAFLQKAIDHVVLFTGETLKIRPNKTVAGHEADRTNEFLQALSRAIQFYSTNHQSALVENEVSKASSSAHFTKKSEKKGSNERRKSEEKSQKRSKNESPKASSGAKGSESKKSERDNTQLQNGYQKNASDEAVKKSSSKSKNVDLKEESSGNIRNASKDRSHHRTKIRSHTKVEDSNNNNNNKEHKERKEIVQNDKDHKRVKEKSSRDNKDSKEKHNNKVERGSKEKHSRTKETPRELKKLVDDNKSSPQRVNINNSPKHFTERRHDEQLSNGVLDNKDVETLVLGSKELTNEKSQLQESSKASPPRRPPTARITTGRPSTTRPTTAQVANGDVLPSPIENKVENVSKETPTQAPNEPFGSQDHETVNRPLTSTLRRSSTRPPTARPAAPRVKVVDSAPEEPPSLDSVSQVSNIILDGVTKDDDEEDDRFIVDDSAPRIFENELINGPISDAHTDGKHHGSLVTQILETKKDLENGSQRPGTGFKRVEMDKSLLSDSTRRKEREIFAREIEKLKGNVQMLTRSANPLGKLIDYLQEDMDSMLRELDMWNMERRKNENALNAEGSKTDAGMEKLHHQLQETEDLIQNEIAKISALKANIIRNEERIQKMIAATQM